MKEASWGSLKERLPFITGGNSGLGLVAAERFVAEGAYVFITGRRQAELDAAVKLIGRNVTAVQGDVGKLEDLDRLYTVVREQKGHVDIVFANAGAGAFVPLEQITEEHFDHMFNTDVKGTLSQLGAQRQVSDAAVTKRLRGDAAWHNGRSRCSQRGGRPRDRAR
jgi:NAD(P)-dependent dehydrogenase (short-subunit alcohol dehydrogenase family)